ncbi:MAG: hypothetical protein H9W81_14955 [Enterococcus sp.]|nr:hypothetical protein [Enterococcus sp.]
MKIENLKNGQIVKNYKELCLILDIEPKTGKSKQLQIQALERYCKYHKEGNKFVIDEIFQEVQTKMDKRKLGNNNNQAKCLRYLLCNLLSAYKIEQNEVIGFSKGLLLRKLNLINENYTSAKAQRVQYAQALDVEKIALDECIEYIDNRSINAVKKAMQVLLNQKVIGYKYSYTWVDHTGIHHHCCTLEHNAIMEAEFEVMEAMKIRAKGKIFEFGRWNEFKREVKLYLMDKYGELFKKIDYYYSSFHFNYNMEQLQKHMRYMEEKQEVSFDKAKEGIQELWSKSLDTTINNKYNKATKGAWGAGFNELENYRRSTEYKPEQKKLKNSIVKQDYPKIEFNEQIIMDLDQVEIPF